MTTPSRQRDIRFLRIGMDPAHTIATHSHTTHQLLRVEQGALCLAHAQWNWVIPTDGTAWLPAGAPHQLEALDHVDAAVLYVRARPRDRFVPAGPVDVSPLLAALVATLSRPVPDRVRRKRLEQVVRDELADLRTRTFVVAVPHDAAARAVALQLLAEPADNRPLDALAEDAGTSVRTLQRRFRAETGLPFQTWRRRAGLQHAMTVLARGGNVTDAAHRCGFASASAFIAAFRAELGTTPAAWQRSAVVRR